MKPIAIITGDIVDSTSLNPAGRDAMIAALQEIPEILLPVCPTSIEIFRGDGFQIMIKDAAMAARAAIAIRAWLRSRPGFAGKRPLDARLAIGIGSADYTSDSLSTSDGEAFRLSGRLLDRMHRSRLEIASPWHDVNEELNLSTSFADDIISSWTQNQSKVMLLLLQTFNSHTELAHTLGVSRQMVDKSLKASKEDLIKSYINRFATLISRHIEEP